MNKKIALLLVCVMTFSLAGCTKNDDPLLKMKKKELVDLANSQYDELSQAYVKIDEIENLLRGIQDEEVPSAAISTINDGTGRLTFNSFQNKIVFPKPFEYPDSSQISNTASVNVTQSLRLSPTSNWAMRSFGPTLEIEHTSGISGIIKAGFANTVLPREELKDNVFTEFFVDFPPETVRYSKLFLDDNWWGMQAMTKTTIDEEDAFLRCGMVALGEQSFIYMFVYKGNQDIGKDETVLTLIQTIKLNGQSLRVEE